MTERVAYIRELIRGMAGRRTNIALLLLLLLAVATGALSFALGTGWAAWPTVLHGMAALGILLVAPWKWRIMRRGMTARRLRSTWPSVLLGVTVTVAIVSGVMHATGLVLRYGPLDDMQVHVVAAIAALLLGAWHVIARGNLPARQDLTRRNLMRSGLLLAGAAAVWGGLEGAMRLAELPGRQRRFTGSYDHGSHAPESMPSIIWLFDPRLDLRAEDWSLSITSGAGERRLTYDDIRGHDDRITATIDCTSGWYAEQDWAGVALPGLLGDLPSDARSVVVRSQTGYWRRFPLRDLDDLLLATRYEGRTLDSRHGFPARLVAPGRRGFWWVKWVTHIEVTDEPWLRQPPYPLQ